MIGRTVEVIKNEIRSCPNFDNCLPLQTSIANFHCLNYQKVFQKILLQLRDQIKKLSSKNKNQAFQSEVTLIKFD